ncbi:trehalose-phosphatase [Consotaella salsifontis]|uniref:Trehalose 6-phosphate phosphatase n=1 Tax=Consotaella salsifontis TaxID=1365950 RepID=A0A1T4S5S0_9HYPH|nr:trehalose-phosphatase [Consotaella salsifontis]SKA23426.1 trehalose 6-phosphatase [Consotaella salsifontis]
MFFNPVRTSGQPPVIDPSGDALFLDFDGTLIEMADHPDLVTVESELIAHLGELQRACSGALALVSGRRIVDLDRFLAPLRFSAAGVHGLEQRLEPEGASEPICGPEMLDEARESIRAAIAAVPGLNFEDKGTALVLHYRTAPELDETAKRIMRDAIAGRDDLVVMDGKRVIEVHPAGMDKGRAVAALMQRPPFAGRRPVFIGDDLTDEHALAFVREQGGVSIKVGIAQTCAEFRLEDVAAVRRWLGLRT